MRHEFNPAHAARMVAALNILSGVGTGYSISVLRKVFARGDPATTAANILASETAVRLGIVAELAALIAFVAGMFLLYELFKPAGRRLSLFVFTIVVMGATVQSLDVLCDTASLVVLKGGTSLAAIPVAQSQALAYVFLSMHGKVYNTALFFLGVASLALGFLVRDATFLPRIIGPLVMIDGLGYLTAAIALIVSPSFALHIVPPLPFITAIIGEGPLFLWLLVKGVNVERWRAQLSESRLGGP
jgi:hypothetical protein